MSKTLAEKLNNQLEKEQEITLQQKEEIYNLKVQMETLARDLKGVGRIIDVIHNITELNDMEANISAFNNINRLIVDIASSMEATVNGDSHFIG